MIKIEMLKTYLKNIKDLTPSDTEHSHRTDLENLLKTIIDDFCTSHDKITLKHEPNRNGGGFA